MTPEIQKTLRLCPTLPTLSSVAMQIIEIGRYPDIDLREVAQLLSSDPALATKTLRVANSPLYVRDRKARNLREAVNVLGLNATVSLALSFSLSTCLRQIHETRLDLDRYWRRALLSALAARLLGAYFDLGSRQELFLAGLLQDLGVLALDAALPARYAGVVAGCTDHEQLAARERNAMSIDHCEAGAWLMSEWGLPDYLALATRNSHALGGRDSPSDMALFTGCIAVSGRIAEIYLAADTDTAIATASDAARACLDMSAEQLGDILAEMTESLPEVEAFFEMSVLSATEAAGLTDQAQEILASRHFKLLQSTTQHYRRELEYRRQADHLHEIARRDALTDVFNRRHLDEILTDQFTHDSDNNDPISLAYLDLDHFKSVNDQYGHPTGDDILVAVARQIQTHLRDGDLLARYGGEEFILLMPGVDEAAAQQIVNRIREAVEVLEHRLETGEILHVTLSAGVASFSNDQIKLYTPDHLVREADYALYKAKHQGRNRVVVASR